MVNTEFGKLKKVLVGTPHKARVPQMDVSLRVVNYADKRNVSDVSSDCYYPDQVIQETQEDVDSFVQFLESQGIDVLHPDISSDPEYYYYCPRDTVLSFKDMLIATPMPIRARNKEHLSIFKNNQATLGKRCIDVTNNFTDKFYNLDCVGNKNILALNETYPAFDAANCLKHHDNIFYLVSNSGNEAGAKLLQEIVGVDVTVHLVRDIYSYMHIDSTIAILRDGLLMVNPTRVKSKDQLPPYFKKWEVIFAPEAVDIGHYPGYCNSSKWINVNLFSISPDLVVVEKNQKNLINVLEKYKIDCAPLQLRHARTLGGCWHCITLDLERE